jgi:hypothetical protein
VAPPVTLTIPDDLQFFMPRTELGMIFSLLAAKDTLALFFSSLLPQALSAYPQPPGSSAKFASLATPHQRTLTFWARA